MSQHLLHPSGIPVSISLGVTFMTGVNASGLISVLAKNYQKKLKKVTKLIDIVTLPALVVFEGHIWCIKGWYNR